MKSDQNIAEYSYCYILPYSKCNYDAHFKGVTLPALLRVLDQRGTSLSILGVPVYNARNYEKMFNGVNQGELDTDFDRYKVEFEKLLSAAKKEQPNVPPSKLKQGIKSKAIKKFKRPNVIYEKINKPGFFRKSAVGNLAWAGIINIFSPQDFKILEEFKKINPDLFRQYKFNFDFHNHSDCKPAEVPLNFGNGLLKAEMNDAEKRGFLTLPSDSERLASYWVLPVPIPNSVIEYKNLRKKKIFGGKINVIFCGNNKSSSISNPSPIITGTSVIIPQDDLHLKEVADWTEAISTKWGSDKHTLDLLLIDNRARNDLTKLIGPSTKLRWMIFEFDLSENSTLKSFFDATIHNSTSQMEHFSQNSNSNKKTSGSRNTNNNSMSIESTQSLNESSISNADHEEPNLDNTKSDNRGGGIFLVKNGQQQITEILVLMYPPTIHSKNNDEVKTEIKFAGLLMDGDEDRQMLIDFVTKQDYYLKANKRNNEKDNKMDIIKSTSTDSFKYESKKENQISQIPTEQKAAPVPFFRQTGKVDRELTKSEQNQRYSNNKVKYNNSGKTGSKSKNVNNNKENLDTKKTDPTKMDTSENTNDVPYSQNPSNGNNDIGETNKNIQNNKNTNIPNTQNQTEQHANSGNSSTVNSNFSNVSSYGNMVQQNNGPAAPTYTMQHPGMMRYDQNARMYGNAIAPNMMMFPGQFQQMRIQQMRYMQQQQIQAQHMQQQQMQQQVQQQQIQSQQSQQPTIQPPHDKQRQDNSNMAQYAQKQPSEQIQQTQLQRQSGQVHQQQTQQNSSLAQPMQHQNYQNQPNNNFQNHNQMNQRQTNSTAPNESRISPGQNPNQPPNQRQYPQQYNMNNQQGYSIPQNSGRMMFQQGPQVEINNQQQQNQQHYLHQQQQQQQPDQNQIANQMMPNQQINNPNLTNLLRYDNNQNVNNNDEGGK